MVAKLDRLQPRRGVSFPALWLSASRSLLPSLAADADAFLLHLYAALAEKERDMIRARTKPPLTPQGQRERSSR